MWEPIHRKARPSCHPAETDGASTVLHGGRGAVLATCVLTCHPVTGLPFPAYADLPTCAPAQPLHGDLTEVTKKGPSQRVCFGGREGVHTGCYSLTPGSETNDIRQGQKTSSAHSEWAGPRGTSLGELCPPVSRNRVQCSFTLSTAPCRFHSCGATHTHVGDHQQLERSLIHISGHFPTCEPKAIWLCLLWLAGQVRREGGVLGGPADPRKLGRRLPYVLRPGHTVCFPDGLRRGQK